MKILWSLLFVLIFLGLSPGPGPRFLYAQAFHEITHECTTTSSVLVAKSSRRSMLFLQQLSGTNLWISFSGPAIVGRWTMLPGEGQSFAMFSPGGIPVNEITCITESGTADVFGWWYD